MEPIKVRSVHVSSRYDLEYDLDAMSRIINHLSDVSFIYSAFCDSKAGSVYKFEIVNRGIVSESFSEELQRVMKGLGIGHNGIIIKDIETDKCLLEIDPNWYEFDEEEEETPQESTTNTFFITKDEQIRIHVLNAMTTLYKDSEIADGFWEDVKRSEQYIRTGKIDDLPA